jgi:hypothetical protein
MDGRLRVLKLRGLFLFAKRILASNILRPVNELGKSTARIGLKERGRGKV